MSTSPMRYVRESLAMSPSKSKGWKRAETSQVYYGYFRFKGFGLFGEEGKQIGNYTIHAMHIDRTGGGTFLSIKQNKIGGNLLRWDYGLNHEIGFPKYDVHSTFRFNINGNTYGSTKQYPWYAPFQYWKYKK